MPTTSHWITELPSTDFKCLRLITAKAKTSEIKITGEPVIKTLCNRMSGLSAAAILLAAGVLGSPAFGLDYYNYGNNGSFLNVAAEYSNTDGSTVNATVTPNSATNDLFFLNSTVVGSSGALTFYTGTSTIRFNSMTFRSNVGSIQLDRDTVGSATSGIINMRGGGITMEAGAGPVTWGGADQRVVLGAEADFTIANNSSSDLTFNREVLSYTNNTTHTITVAGSGSGNTIFYDVRTNTVGRETAMTINTSGSGIVKFAGNNTYLGATTISAGTLQIGDGGTSGRLATGSAITNNGTLVFNRSNAVTQGTDFASVVAGTGNLVQAGSGNLTLVGNNTYNGMTTVSAGNLFLNNTANNSQTIVGDVTINGGRLAYQSSRPNQIADTSSITMSNGEVDFGTLGETINSMAMSGGTLRRASGTLVLNAASSFTGGSLIFSSASASRINTTGTTTLGNVTFDLSSGSTSAFDLVRLGGNIQVNPDTTANFTNSAGGVGRLGLNANRTIDVGSGGTLNMGWNVFGTSVGITKNGTGSLVLTANNTYAGATVVNAGTLIVNGSLAAGSALTVASGATLGGVGTINGAATVNGFLRPGNSPGILNFGSSLALGATSEITMELNGTVRGTEYDGINVTGALTYGGNLTINVGSAFLASDSTFSLFTFASQTGGLAFVSLAGAYGAGDFTNSGGIWSLTDSGGNQWSLSQADGNLGFTAVPEPSTWALLGLFGLACAGWKLRGLKRREAKQTGNPV
jgi:fibronectin-binding autotransporter adhesin